MKTLSKSMLVRNDAFITIVKWKEGCRQRIPIRSLFSVETISSQQQTSNSNSEDSQQQQQQTASTANGKSQSFVSFKQKLLKEALEHVQLYGFTNEAIAAASANQQQNISMATAGLISTSDLVCYVMERNNAMLKRDLREKIQEWNTLTTASTKSELEIPSNIEKISWALQRRLEYVQDYVKSQQWANGMAIGARPDNILTTRQQLEHMIDIVTNELDLKCLYLEQLSLGSIYVATELHMLADTSTDFQDTWSFLRQRVQDWEHWRAWMPRADVPPNLAGNELWKNHTPSDVVFTASAVASALFSGAQSIVGTASNAKPFLYTAQSDAVPVNNSQTNYDGTDPSHYDIPAKEN